MTRRITVNVSGIDVSQWMPQQSGYVVVVAVVHRQVEWRPTYFIRCIDANARGVPVAEQSSEQLWVFINSCQMNRQFALLITFTVEVSVSFYNC